MRDYTCKYFYECVKFLYIEGEMPEKGRQVGRVEVEEWKMRKGEKKENEGSNGRMDVLFLLGIKQEWLNVYGTRDRIMWFSAFRLINFESLAHCLTR